MVMPSERMCRDLRSMQLFAEQVLSYRLNQDPTQFRSYGFHEPNTEEGRQVYTVVGDQLYYFLPKLSLEAVHRTLRQIPTVVSKEQPFGLPIQQVILVGESSTVSDRDRLQEAIDNYQPSRFDSRLPAPILPEARQEAWQTTNNLLASSLSSSLSESNDAAVIPTVSDAAASTAPMTTFPTQAAQPLPLKLRLSYINEDSYWDPRQDDLTVKPEGLIHDRASQITAWLQKHPSASNFDLNPVAAPVGTALQSPVTQLQSPETVTMSSTLETPVEPIVGLPETRVDGRDRRSNDWFKTGPLANAWPLLTLLGALGLLLWLAQWGRNQLVNTASNDYSGVNAPPPPNQLTTTNSTSSFSTTRTDTAVNQAAANNRSAIVTNNAATNNSQTTRAAVANVTKLPPVGFWVRAASPHDGVNLRTGPGVENRKIRGIPNGYWVVDEGRTIGNWQEVSFQGQRGWVYRPFIR
jgi:hypothetical protein